MVTAVTLISLAPKAVSLPGLQEVNRQLEEQIAERRQAESDSEQMLKDLADQKFALDQHAIVATTDVQRNHHVCERQVLRHQPIFARGIDWEES